MNLQDQWTNLYTEVFKLHREMTQDGSLFLNNKTKLPLSVRVKCFFRIIKVKKYSNYVDKFSKKIIESLHYVKCTLAALYKGNVSFIEDEFAEFLYKDDSEQFERYKRFRDQQVDLYRERLEKEQTVLQTNIVDLCAVLDTLNIIKGALRQDFGMPSTHYYRTVHQGYRDCNLDTSVLSKALGDSAQRFYSSAVGSPSLQMRMRFPEPPPPDDVDEDEEPIEDEELDEEYDEEDDIVDEPDEEIDENDPFYFSDGMHW